MLKMLQAAKFDMAEDALVCWLLRQGSRSAFRRCAIEAGFSNAMFFGISPKQAGMNLNLQAIPAAFAIGGVNYLFSASLTEILANPALKRPLWDGMKGMFRV
ncbi:MAG: hypothetical protein V9G98_26125 [Candidatus Competibacter sp.]